MCEVYENQIKLCSLEERAYNKVQKHQIFDLVNFLRFDSINFIVLRNNNWSIKFGSITGLVFIFEKPCNIYLGFLQKIRSENSSKKKWKNQEQKFKSVFLSIKVRTGILLHKYSTLFKFASLNIH